MADRFSLLPDEVICHILTFLPTEDAFTTSFLSKRWKSLWLLDVTTLDLDDAHFLKIGKPNSLFRKMISILVRSVHHQHIKRIRLRCRSVSNYFNSEDDEEEEDSANFKTWLTAAAERGLEHLHIHLSRICYKLDFIFSLRTLVFLELKMVYVHSICKEDLRSLKTLRLNRVEFRMDWFLPDLLNGCPNLEVFEGRYLSVTNWDPDYEFSCRSLSKLASANISNLADFAIPFDIFSNVEFFRLEEIYIDLPMFSNLTHVKVIYVRTVYWKLVFDVFENCPKLQDFFLGKPQILISEDILWYCPCVVPKCLSSEFRKCTVTNYIGEKYEKEFVKYIVENSTSIQEMAMHTPTSLDPQRLLELQNELSYLI